MSSLSALLFLALALLAEIAGTVGGFGSSTFFVPIANQFFDFQSVLGITALFHLLSNASKLALFRRGIDRRLLLAMGVPAAVFAVLGGLATPLIPVAVLEIGLGLFLVVMSAALLLRGGWELGATTPTAIAGGALSGAMAGMIGTGGAVRGLALAAFDLPKEVFVATSAAIDMGIDLSRSAVYFRNGYVHGHDLVWLPLLALVAFVGTWIGRRVLQYLPQMVFRRLALALVFAIGCLTLYQAAP